MQTVQPWMRFKVKADTFFLPTPDGSVYFRNNRSSFRMEGTSVLSWIQHLLPVFDGQQSIESLTDGLPDVYRDRIYEIAAILYSNGFLRDVSTDKAHGMPTQLLDTYAAQIEFLDNLGGSGAHRFEVYRNASILVVGSGSILSSIVSALMESGLSTVHVADPESDPTDAIQTMDAVLYVSDSGDLDTLRRVETLCREAETLFFSAFSLGSAAFIVPTVNPESDTHVTFDGVWKRIHPTAFHRNLDISGFTDVAAAVLANVLVFELFKVITDVDKAVDPRLYILDGETLEGQWHGVIPAHALSSNRALEAVENLRGVLMTDDAVETNMAEALSRFADMTNPVTGVFHVWDESDLPQIPLAQCRVQPVDPLSSGPANLMPARVCVALTHDEARYEAGLTGIETYVRRQVFGGANEQPEMGVGAGLTFAEAVGRGLQRALTTELKRVIQEKPYTVRRIQLGRVDDEVAQFCLVALQTAGHDPVIWRGDDVLGSPALWMQMGDTLVGSAGLSTSIALQRLLAHVLLLESEPPSETAPADGDVVVARSTSVIRAQSGGDSIGGDSIGGDSMDVDSWQGFTSERVLSALEALEECGASVEVANLAFEEFLRDAVAAVVGVSITWGALS